MHEDLHDILKVIQTPENERLAVSSKDVAEKFGKEHFNVIRDVRNLCKHLPKDFAVRNFDARKIKVLNGQGEEVSEVLMTRDGFALLAMGFTGKEALQWKVRFIEAFNYLEEIAMLALKEEKTNADKFRLEVARQIAKADEYISYLTKDIAELSANQKKARKPSKPRLLKMPSLHIDLMGSLAFTWAHKMTKEEADFWQVRICSIVHMALICEGVKRKAKKEMLQAVRDFRAQFKNSALQATDEEILDMLSGVIIEGVAKMSTASVTD